MESLVAGADRGHGDAVAGRRRPADRGRNQQRCAASRNQPAAADPAGNKRTIHGTRRRSQKLSPSEAGEFLHGTMPAEKKMEEKKAWFIGRRDLQSVTRQLRFLNDADRIFRAPIFL